MSIKHAHKVHRYTNVNGTWTCDIRGCRHFLPGNVPRGPLGRESICHNCGDVFEMDNVAMTQVKPVCQTCDADNPIRVLGEGVEFTAFKEHNEVITNQK